MRIKKLELVGFKSFKDKTVIQFDAGITGIVGPNGCGKSNIVDALVWVMGEMSAKHLRGSSMEDVIFAGSDGHAPGGMAEVSMVLENDGGPFPAKYMGHSEIMITRRLHRSGESEYLVNKQQARLRDIQEVFMDTGAGSKGFSIIEQGAIGKIITAKPEDRRTLIEEAAGITKFKARKRESQRKLTATDQNLIRLNDIVTELKRQLDSLQRQAQRAERYKKLKDQAQDLDLWLSSTEYLELEKTVQEARELFEQAQSIEIESEADLGQHQADVEELRTRQIEKEKEVEAQQIEHAKLQGSVRDLENLIIKLGYQIEQGQESKAMQGTLMAESEKRRELLLEEIKGLSEKLNSLDGEALILNREFDEKQSALQAQELGLDNAEEELSEKRGELVRVTEELSTASGRSESLEGQTEEILSRLTSAKSVLAELLEQNKDFDKRRKKVLNELENEKQLQFGLMQDATSMEDNKKALQERTEQKRKEVEEYKDRLNEVTSRLYGLENLQSNFEGFQEGVKNIMLWQKQRTEVHADGSVSTFKPVADVVEVQPGFEIAMEAALGTQLQTLLGDDSGSVLEAVDYLKAESTGRSSFIASEFMSSISEKAIAPTGEGVVSRLTDVVNVPEKYQNKVALILDEVIVVDSIRSALSLRPEYPGWTFVTREGDILDKNGVLTGGAAESADSGVLKRKAEIKELSARKDEWAGKLSLAQESLKRLEEQLKNLDSELENAKERTSRKEILLTELKKDLERADNELESVQAAMDRQQNEVIQIETTMNSHKDEVAALHEKSAQLRLSKEELEADIERIQEELTTGRLSLSDAREEVTQLKVVSAQKSQELHGLRSQKERLDLSLADAEGQIDRMSDESSKNSEALSANQVLLEEKKIEFDRSAGEVQTSEQRLGELRNEFETTLAQVREVEEKINACLSEKSERQSKMNDAQLKLDQSNMKLQYLAEQIEERYMVDLAAVAANYADREGDAEAAKVELEDLKKKIGRIGEVNLSAIEEFGELEERYNFLSKQQEDLIEAKEQLRKVIDRINRICSKRFKETFEAVNERFQKVFPVLFGGGESRLILVEDEEKGEMGIDIVAKPPGKKMTSVSLMSGGEKALTAVSLIFSIFLVKPSPYCLLDEVDAPLDDANVSRFNDLVKEMAKRSQIIIVTHNKHTMAVNKKLYGVTMEERGVSKMVSVSLDEAEKVAEV